MKTDHSEIVHGPGGSTYVGADAVNFVRAVHLAAALRLHASTRMVPTRNVTITHMKAMATGYTGKAYRKGDAETRRAAEDVKHWADTMRAALPVTIKGDTQ
jgi:hypothetical protein